MSRLFALAFLVLAAACGTTSQPAGPGSGAGPTGSAGGSAVGPAATPDAAPAAADATPTAITPSAGDDCGTLDKAATRDANRRAEECFAAGFRAGRAAHLERVAVSTEGGVIETTFRVVPGTPPIVERTVDDHDDEFASAPGIHVTRCRDAHIDKDTGWVTGVQPQDCR